MASQNSKTTRTVLSRLKKTRYLGTSSRTQEENVNRKLDFFYQDLASPGVHPPPGGELPQAEETGPPDWSSFQQTNIRVLALVDVKLRNSDLAYRIARAVYGAGAAESKERIGVLCRYYSDMKILIEGTYGKEYLYVLALDAPRADSRMGVREQLQDVHGRMLDPAQLALLPDPKPGRKALDFEELAVAVKAVLDEFEGYLQQQDERLKAKQAASIQRQETMAYHARVYANVGRIQEGLYRLAGLDELADRIRVRIRSLPSSGENGETGETPEPPAATSEPPTSEPPTPEPATPEPAAL